MNRSGAAGRRGVPGATVAAFLDHYTYTGYNPSVIPVDTAPVRTRRINGVPLTPSWQRSIRRWRNGAVAYISAKGLLHTLDTFGFDVPEFHRWAKAHDLPIT